ncbi:MAG: cupin domain-containing protein [Candidatus Gracilibacteria bacterium]
MQVFVDSIITTSGLKEDLNMSSVVCKQAGAVHFNKDFGGGASSDRLILPAVDGCGVKVVKFNFVKGFKAQGVVQDCDETVYIVSGCVIISDEQGESYKLTAGATYHAPGGVSYNVEAETDGAAICVLTRSTDGGMPDDD